MKPLSVVLAGGGSAGHVWPLLSLADRLCAEDPQVQIAVLGTAQGLEARLVPERGYALDVIPKVPLPRSLSPALLTLPQALRGAIAAATASIDAAQADVVVGFGGYVSAPAYLAAKRRGVRVVVHEQNAKPGIANRLGARFATAVAVTFADTPLPRAQVTGMPLRPEIATLDRDAARPSALLELGLEPGFPTVVVTGGSLGARRINESCAQAERAFADAGIQVLHITGAGKEFDSPIRNPGEPAYVVVPYLDRMEVAYAAADLVIARSGANTVCELSALGIPAVLVPLPIGNGEQRLNASNLVAAGGAVLIDDADFSAQWIESVALALLRDPHRLRQMAIAAGSVGEREGDRLLAELVLASADPAMAASDPNR